MHTIWILSMLMLIYFTTHISISEHFHSLDHKSTSVESPTKKTLHIISITLTLDLHAYPDKDTRVNAQEFPTRKSCGFFFQEEVLLAFFLQRITVV